MNRYGAEHRAIRRALLASAAGTPCVRCGVPLRAGDDVDLDHRDDGRGYLGMAHAACNRAAGARKGNRLRGKRKRIRMDDPRIAVEISHDRLHTSIAAAGRSGAVVVVELIGYLAGSDTAEQVAAMAAGREVKQVTVDPRSPAATLIAPLKGLGLTVNEPKAVDMAVAHGRFVDELRAGRLKYVAHPALDAAVQFAGSRPLAGAEAIERRKVEADAGPLAAAELAVWSVLDGPKKAAARFVDLADYSADDDW